MARSRGSRRHKPAQGAPKCLILDSGAVIALSRDDVRVRAALVAARKVGADVTIPSVVIAETVRGNARDAAVNQVLEAVDLVQPIDEPTARIGGSLLDSASSDLTVDALVVAAAIQLGGGVLLTGDPGDLGALADGYPEVVIESI